MLRKVNDLGSEQTSCPSSARGINTKRRSDRVMPAIVNIIIIIIIINMILYVPTVRVKNEVAESRASGQEVSPLVQPSHQYSRKTTARCHRVVEGFIVIIINTFRPLEHCTRCIHEYNIIINVYMHEHLAAVTYIYTGKVSTT